MFKAGGAIMIIRTYLYGEKLHSYGVTVKQGVLQVLEHPTYYAYDLEVSNRTRRIISFMHTKWTTY